jgi:hypothetical protein
MENIYDGTFHCTYKQLDDDDLYRIQFLQAFKMNELLDDELRKKMDILFDYLGFHFTKIFNRLKNEKSCLSHMLLFLGENPGAVDLFQTLFCADVFQETHLCISNILRTGIIDLDNYELLEKALFC